MFIIGTQFFSLLVFGCKEQFPYFEMSNMLSLWKWIIIGEDGSTYR